MRVFYSFSLTHDGPLVTSLADALRRRGYEPTIPVDRHIRVHNWRSRLAEALRKSDIAVVIVTPRNEHSPYVMGELWAGRVLSQMNRRFVLVPVLCDTGGIPDYLSDLFVANSRGGPIADPESLADEIDSIVRDNRDFEIAVADLKPRVFIGHGHASDWKKISEFVSNELGLVVEEYEKESVVGYTVTARLEQMLATSSLAIIVMSPEDEQKGETLRARQNVVHEVGLFQGRLGFDKVIPLRHKSCEVFSNLSGINEIQYDSDNWGTVFAKIRGVAEREGLVPRKV
jgi:Predicted nucleotide-binding protein containing TIR-like domain/TIR domain